MQPTNVNMGTYSPGIGEQAPKQALESCCLQSKLPCYAWPPPARSAPAQSLGRGSPRPWAGAWARHRPGVRRCWAQSPAVPHAGWSWAQSRLLTLPVGLPPPLKHIFFCHSLSFHQMTTVVGTRHVGSPDLSWVFQSAIRRPQ